MKYKLFVFLFCTAMAWCGFAQKSTVSGLINGCPPSARFLLLTVDNGKLKTVDTLGLDSHNRYKVERNVEKVDFFVLQLLPDGINVQHDQQLTVHVMLLPKEKVTLDMDYMPTINYLKITQSKGSDNMNVYRQFNNLLLDATLDASLQPQLPAQVSALLDAHRSELMSAFLVTFFDSDFDHYAPLYKHIHDGLAPRYADNGFVQYIASRLNRVAAMVGEAAPDIVMKGRDGHERRLSSLRGKVVLVDFWASWCRPCRMENPNVVRLYHKYKDQGFEIFSVSMDQNRDAWLKAISDDGLVWENHVSDLKGWTSSGGKTYGISSIPATVLVAADGTIIARNLRGAELEAKLDEIFSHGQK